MTHSHTEADAAMRNLTIEEVHLLKMLAVQWHSELLAGRPRLAEWAHAVARDAAALQVERDARWDAASQELAGEFVQVLAVELPGSE